jgi:serine/threonine protein kinase
MRLSLLFEAIVKSCPHCKSTYPTHFTVCPQDASPLEEIGALAEGTVLRGKYKILSKLGEGGMGAVYKARHIRFDEVCALKVVLPDHLQDPTFLQRFNAEAVLMRRLDHPHAVRVQDVDETEDGLPFFVMEYVEGEALDVVLRRGPLAIDRAIRIASQACEALAAAHRQGVIHRDIKPGNLLLARTAEGLDHVKLLDFGIAKVKAGSPLREGASITQTGAFVGTPSYMSPEQCKGVHGDQLTGASDLYSLGVVLYHMLTGRVPFKADTGVGVLMAHMQQLPPDPRDFRPDIPPKLVAVILRAMEKDPARRFASADEMREALEEAASSLDKTSVARRATAQPEEVTRETVTPLPRAEERPGVPLGVGSAADTTSAPTTVPPHVEETAPGREREPARPVSVELRRSRLGKTALAIGGSAAILLMILLVVRIGQRGAQMTAREAEGPPPSGKPEPSPRQPPEKKEPRPEEISKINPPLVPEPKRVPPEPAPVVPQFALSKTLEGHAGGVLAVAFTRVGLILASGSLDDTVGLWDPDPKEGRFLGALRGHTGAVYGVAFSPNGKLLASGSSDSTVRIWEVATGRTVRTLAGHADRVYSVAFSPDGQTLATASKDGTIKLWDVESGRETRTLAGHTAAVTAVIFSPDGKELASGGEDAAVMVWDSKSGQPIETLRGHTNYVHSVALSPDGKILASASNDQTLRLWDVQSGNALRTLTGHKGYVEAVAFSPDGRTIASGGEDGTVRFWDLLTGKQLGILTGFSGSVTALAFGKNGKILAAGGADKTIRLWQRVDAQ